MTAPTTGVTAPTKTRPHFKSGYADCVDFQGVIKDEIMNHRPKPIDLAALIRAWDVLEERKRIIRMRPKPGDMPVDPFNLMKMLRRVKAGEKIAGSKTAAHTPILDMESPTPEPAQASDPTTPDTPNAQPT